MILFQRPETRLGLRFWQEQKSKSGMLSFCGHGLFILLCRLWSTCCCSGAYCQRSKLRRCLFEQVQNKQYQLRVKRRSDRSSVGIRRNPHHVHGTHCSLLMLRCTKTFLTSKCICVDFSHCTNKLVFRNTDFRLSTYWSCWQTDIYCGSSEDSWCRDRGRWHHF